MPLVNLVSSSFKWGGGEWRRGSGRGSRVFFREDGTLLIDVRNRKYCWNYHHHRKYLSSPFRPCTRLRLLAVALPVHPLATPSWVAAALSSAPAKLVRSWSTYSVEMCCASERSTERLRVFRVVLTPTCKEETKYRVLRIRLPRP